MLSPPSSVFDWVAKTCLKLMFRASALGQLRLSKILLTALFDSLFNALVSDRVLDWEESPISALIYFIVLVFGFTPICTVLLWGLSLLGRRYEEESENELAKTNRNTNTNEKNLPCYVIHQLA